MTHSNTVVIKKGDHKGSPSLHKFLFKRKEIVIDVALHDSWVYKTVAAENQGDICKIAGVASIPWWKLLLAVFIPAGSLFMIRQHHKNSFRIGVTYDLMSNENIIYAYSYINKKRQHKILTKMTRGDKYRFTIRNSGTKDQLFISIENIRLNKVLTTTAPGNLSFCMFTLNTYFGGNETAPHTMYTDLTWHL
jgi:hypothetical protein